MTLRCWQHTIYQDEWLLMIFYVQGCQEGVYTKNWIKKFQTLTTNPKYVTVSHFQEKLSPLF